MPEHVGPSPFIDKEGNMWPQRYGSRAKVFHGTAYETTGRRQRKHFMLNKFGYIVSVARSQQAKDRRHLQKAGFRLSRPGERPPRKGEGGRRHEETK